MLSVSPVASSSVAALRLQPVDTPDSVASIVADMVPVPAALDPRSSYALSTQVADAVLSLAQLRTPAPDSLAPLPQQTGVETSGHPKITGDTAPAAKAHGEIALAVPAPTNYSDAVPSSGSKAADSDIIKALWAEDAVKAQSYIYDVTHVSGDIVNAVGVYLMCNNIHYRDYKSEHPSLDVHWINVNSKKIVAVWPKLTDQLLTRR